MAQFIGRKKTEMMISIFTIH